MLQKLPPQLVISMHFQSFIGTLIVIIFFQRDSCTPNIACKHGRLGIYLNCTVYSNVPGLIFIVFDKFRYLISK